MSQMKTSSSAKIVEFPLAGFSGGQDKSTSDSEESLSNSSENPCCEKTTPAKQPLVTPELLDDLQSLSKTELRKKYSREANSHKNRKADCNKSGASFADEFAIFSDFLTLVGVCPGPGKWTLDRIDNENPDYFPGGVRWANAKTQNNNKSDTILLSDKGVTRPLTEWAEIEGTAPDTMRKRHQRGWSDHEVIYGRPKSRPARKSKALSDWKRLIPDRPLESYEALEARYQLSRQPYYAGSRRESRQCWLAAVAIQHIEALKPEMEDNWHAESDDPALDYQYDCWRATLDRINGELAATTGGSVSNYPHVFKGRKTGRLRWKQ